MLDIKAVAFDLDGTLYPNVALYKFLVPFALKEARFLRAFAKARKHLREELSPPQEYRGLGFYVAQAMETARLLGDPSLECEIKDKIEQQIYRGWEPFFKRINLYPHVKETLGTLKKAGFRLGLLSDFPLKRKIEYLGLEGLWDAMICSEEQGELKPAVKPFSELAAHLDTKPQEILYVGNSLRYDVQGSRLAGMLSALKTSFFKARSLKDKADFVFYDYRQLEKYLMVNIKEEKCSP